MDLPLLQVKAINQFKLLFENQLQLAAIFYI
jgi:hypothetical protein